MREREAVMTREEAEGMVLRDVRRALSLTATCAGREHTVAASGEQGVSSRDGQADRQTQRER